MSFLVLALAVSPAAARPLKPSNNWQVDYAETSCTAKRAFGDHVIALVPSPLGSSTRMIVEGPGRSAGMRQFPSIIDPADGQGAVKASSLVYPAKTKGLRGIYTVIPNELVARMLASGKVEVRAGGRLDNRILEENRVAASMGAALEIGGGTALRQAIETCMKDLRAHWGMVDGMLPEPTIANQPQGDVRGLFSGQDYPDDAADAGQSGTSSFVLMIDEKGAVMDCAVRQSSGVASLDAMGCRVLRERAKFVAARNSANRPVKSVYVTPSIRWMVE